MLFVYLWNSPYQLSMAEQIFLKLDMYIMASEPLPMTYFINPSTQSVCLYVYPILVARQQLDKNVTATTDIY
jgi:hypothetical protein